MSVNQERSIRARHAEPVQAAAADQPQFSRRKTVVFSLATAVVCLAVVSVPYLGYTIQRTRSLYWYTKGHQRGWTANIQRADAELGFAPVPNARGAEVFPDGHNIPVHHDKDGFRIPAGDDPSVGADDQPRPTLLTLGCSFTYGATNAAEDTYPYLVGKYLGGTTKNGGVCAYGLTQMVILARRLIPVLKPEYVIVQYSPWLTERALNPFAPAYFGKVPVPFIHESSGGLAIHRPVFEAAALRMPVDSYRHTPKNVLDFASFFWQVGLPLLAHDDFHMLLYRVRALAGSNLTSIEQQDVRQFLATHRQRVESFVYKEIGKVARGARTTVVVVVVGAGERVPFEGLFPDDFLVVDAQAELLRHLPDVTPATYQKEYGHWRGNPPQLIDGFHPNAKGHQIIAEQIASKIKKSERFHSVTR